MFYLFLFLRGWEFRSYSLQQVAYTIVDNIESLTIKTEKFSESKISKLRLVKKKTLVRSVLSKTKSLAMLNFNHDSKIKFFLLSPKWYTLVQPKIEGRNYS